VAVAGESAGGNLACGIALAACYRRREPWAAAVFEAGVAPRAVIAACAMLQVSDPARHGRKRPLSPWVQDRFDEVAEEYLGHALEAAGPGALDFADPLLVFERGDAPDRPLPPFFAPVGTADLLLHDTRRLRAALHRMGVVCDARYYEGEVHAFQAFIWRKNAQRCWRDMFRFLRDHVS
jgi:acetyl esterase